jgi:hypothetical protein
MPLKSLRPLSALALALGVAAGGPAMAATIVVNNDEWTLSDTGFASAADTGQFVANLVAEFGPTIHAYSGNFGFTQGSLATAMANAGATYTTGTGFDFTAANLSAYDAVFLGGFYLDAAGIAELSSYVASGGGVYIAGGTNVGGPAAEAAAWNGFLAPFGVQMNPFYNGVSGNVAVSGDAIFDGVSALYQNNGNGLTGSSVVCCGDSGLYAVYRVSNGDGPAPIPLPATLPLLVAAMGGVGMLVARRRR